MANPRQGDLNHLNLQMANGKVPPSWGPEREKEYPFRFWESDVNLWLLATDLQPQQLGAAIALRLTGSARDLIRELNPQILVQGQMIVDDQGNPQQLTGPEALIRNLRRRFAPLQQEQQIHSLSEFFNFHRNPQEDTDSLISRFEVTYFRAQQIGQCVLNQTALAWMLLHHCHIPKDRWVIILSSTQGNLPSNAAEYADFLNYLRRNGHLFDRHVDPAKSLNNTFAVLEEKTFMSSESSWPQSSAFPSYHSNSPSTYFEADADTDSSCCSFDSSSDIDLTDVHSLPYNEAAESVYLNYRFAKRRWRRFAHPRSNPKGKGRGKGMFRRKFGHSSPHTTAFTDSDLETQWTYWKGKGKGKGKGNHHSSASSGTSYFGRKNPIDKNGKRMLCSICQSDEHFRAKCTSTLAKTHGKTYVSLEETWPGPISSFEAVNSSGSSQATTVPIASNSSQGPKRRIYFSDIPETHSNSHSPAKSIIYFSDGFSEVLEPAAVLPEDAEDPSHAFPWWHVKSNSSDALTPIPGNPEVFHSNVKLKDGREALVIDTGAVNSLAGSIYARRLVQRALAFGQGGQIRSHPAPYSISGVGKGDQSVTEMVQTPIALSDGSQGEYRASVIPDSELPGLLGLVPMINQRVLLDLYNGRYISVGPGGYKLELSPGSFSLPTERSASGHIMLPVSEWRSITGKSKREVAFHADSPGIRHSIPTSSSSISEKVFPMKLQASNAQADADIDSRPHVFSEE